MPAPRPTRSNSSSTCIFSSPAYTPCMSSLASAASRRSRSWPPAMCSVRPTSHRLTSPAYIGTWWMSFGCSCFRFSISSRDHDEPRRYPPHGLHSGLAGLAGLAGRDGGQRLSVPGLGQHAAEPGDQRDASRPGDAIFDAPALSASADENHRGHRVFWNRALDHPIAVRCADTIVWPSAADIPGLADGVDKHVQQKADIGWICLGSRYVDLKYWVSGASIERSPWLAFAREATKPPLQGNQGDPDEDDTNRLSGQNHLPRHRCAQEDVLGDGDL